MSVVYHSQKENVKKNYFCSFYEDLCKKITVSPVNFNFTSDFCCQISKFYFSPKRRKNCFQQKPRHGQIHHVHT